VIFKKKKQRVHHVQPSITYHQVEQQPIVVPDVTPQYHHEEQEAIYVTPAQEHAVTHQPIYEHEHHTEVLAIKERTKPPFNYHVANPTLAPTLEELHERHNPKRMAPYTKEQFEKAKRMMDKSKRSKNSSKVVKS
jgi:hypothetical protein